MKHCKTVECGNVSKGQRKESQFCSVLAEGFKLIMQCSIVLFLEIIESDSCCESPYKMASCLFWKETNQDPAWIMAFGPQCLTFSAWPFAMPFRLFVETVALITCSLYRAHPSFPFSLFIDSLLVYFNILGDIFHQPTTKQTQMSVSVPILERVSDPPRAFFCFTASLPCYCVSPLGRNTCFPSAFPPKGLCLLSNPGGSTQSEGQPSVRTHREGLARSCQRLGSTVSAVDGSRPPSWACSHCLQASTPVLIKESAGVCCHASSLYVLSTTSMLLLRFRSKVIALLGVHVPASLNMPVGGSFGVQLESGFSQLGLHLQSTLSVISAGPVSPMSATDF